MNARNSKFALLTAAAGGLLFAGTCDAVFSTLELVSQIVGVWV